MESRTEKKRIRGRGREGSRVEGKRDIREKGFDGDKEGWERRM